MQTPLEVLALVRARLDAGVPLPEALPDGVTVEAWPDLQREALVGFADALERGDTTLLTAYKTAYEATYAEQAGIETELPLDEARDERRSCAEVPTATPPSPPPPLPPVASAAPDETGFLSADALCPIEAVPFAAEGAATAPQPLGEMTPHEAMGETGFLDAESLTDDPLPFEHRRAAAEPPPLQAPEGSMDGTSFMAAVSVSDALPFEGAAASPPPPTTSSPKGAPHPEAGGTSYVQVDEGSVPQAALPFAATQDGQQDLGELTLQQLAALEVEVAHAVGRVPEVLAHFGVDAKAYRELKKKLAQRTADDPSAAEAFDAEKAAYLTWRKEQPR